MPINPIRNACRPAPVALAVAVAIHGSSAGVPMLSPPTAQAQTARTEQAREYDVPPGPLGEVLSTFAAQAGILLSADGELTAGKRSPGLRGRYTVEQALQRLLAGTGLTYRFTDANTVTLAKAGAQDGEGPMQLGPITVEGGAVNPLAQPGYRADFAVTATRIPLPVEETPRSISVISRDFLDDVNIEGGVEALDYAAGVTFRGAFGSRDLFSIRGFDASTFDSTRLDGLKFTTRTQSLNDALLERVEVLKGPASVLFGVGDPGGIVNFLTKRPADESFVHVEAEAGSFERLSATVDANAPISADGRLKGRIVGAHEETESITDFVETEQQALLASLTFDASPRTRFSLRGVYQRDDNAPPGVLPMLDNGSVPDISRETFVGSRNINRDFFEQALVIADASHEIADVLTLEAKASAIRQDRESVSTYVYTTGGVPASGDTSIFGFRTADVREFYNGEFSARVDLSKYGLPVEILGGADYAVQDADDVDLNAVVPLGAFNIFNPDTDLPAPTFTHGTGFFHQIQRGIFGQAVVRPIEGLTVLLGVRNDRRELENTRFSPTGALTGEQEQTDKATTFQAGASYELLRDVTIYGSFAESFTPNSAVDVNNEVLPPEEGVGFEVGAKVGLFDGQVLVTGALFHITRENIATNDPNNVGFSVAQGERVSKGAELEVAGSPLPGWQVRGAYSFIDAEITENNGVNEGNRPQSVPKHKFSLWGSYTVPHGPYQGLGAGVGVLGNSDFFVTDANDFTISGHARADISVFYRPPDAPYEITLDVKNVTDEKFIPGSRGFKGFAFNFGQPRTFLVRGRLKF